MLWRKMLRDLRENKTAYIACTIVIAIGLMVFTSMSIVIDNLNNAKNEFYDTYHFADVFIKVKSIPHTQVKQLKNIEGVDRVQGRLVRDVRVLKENSDKNIYLRLVSVDLKEEEPLNGVHQLAGFPLTSGEKNIWIGSKFFEANSLTMGHELFVLVDGKKMKLTVVGTGQSPEFVYAMQNVQNLFPDPEAFDIAYMPYEDMEVLFANSGMVNDIVLTLQPGYTLKDIENKLEDRLKKYGLASMVEQKDQLSNVMLTEEFKQLESTVRSVPILFLLIAALILYIMLKRLVEQQRGQIGTLKAFGYGQKEILIHYLSYGGLIGFAGGVMGGIFGSLLSESYTQIYQTFFNLPTLKNTFSPKYFFMGILLSMVCSLIAGFQGSKGVMKLQPADAMRPSTPMFGKKVWIERSTLIWETLTVQGKMAIRNISRNKGRSFFTFIGIMVTFAMIATMWSFQDLIDLMVTDQFTKVQTHDVKITFTRPLPMEQVMRELESKKGVKRVEAMLEVPVTFKNTYRKKDVMVVGLPQDSILYNILDEKENRIVLPKEGAVLAQSIADSLGVSVGDTLHMESPWAKEDILYVNVVAVIPQYLGSNVYMEQNALSQLLRQPKVATSLLLSMEETFIKALKKEYNTSETVASFEQNKQMVEKFQELVGSFAYMIWVMAVMAMVTGFAIVYNSSIISLAERKRELASLRVLGMTPREVLEVISFEQWTIGVVAMVAGVPLTYLLKQSMASSMSNDLYSMPVSTGASSFLVASLGTAVAMIIAQLSVARKIKKLDLVEVLKERD